MKKKPKKNLITRKTSGQEGRTQFTEHFLTCAVVQYSIIYQSLFHDKVNVLHAAEEEQYVKRKPDKTSYMVLQHKGTEQLL